MSISLLQFTVLFNLRAEIIEERKGLEREVAALGERLVILSHHITSHHIIAIREYFSPQLTAGSLEERGGHRKFCLLSAQAGGEQAQHGGQAEYGGGQAAGHDSQEAGDRGSQVGPDQISFIRYLSYCLTILQA